ncbi:MAG: ABC transporter substrate-binding protein [Alphaproteobacteria bacterium HGW-Alphaproteobacteria-8]|nr:MAG: ABC transporter substrate-binding protein [Alphaproteobacteria bacterium HGW-Alphaproteobacteria-8]
MTAMRLSALAILLASAAVPALSADLRIGLQDDADILDPDQSRTFVGRIVYTALCDKLVDITPGLEIVPQLATSWTWSEDGKTLTMTLREGVTFHDGAPFDAEAAKANIERSKTLPESRRKSELASVESVEVTGPLEVALRLSAPDATLMAQLADRAGMMVSPTAAGVGADFGLAPVCSGPFRFVERVQQDRIVLERFADYWNADAITIDRVIYLPIPDTTVRLANLRSGDLDMIERLAATDVAQAAADPTLAVMKIDGLGYQGITINVANGDRAATPMGQDARVRQAFSLAIDRAALNQVVFDGVFTPGNQPFPPSSPWFDQRNPVPARDVAAAKALLAEAGIDRLAVEVQVANNPVQQNLMQVVQAMVAEAGFDVTLQAKEFATLLADQTAGAYQMSQVGWSGRIDPDGNIHQFATCAGGINDSKFCDPAVDALLDAARAMPDPAARKQKYDAANEILNVQTPILYLYHQPWIWALDRKVEGFVAYPDGMIRLEGVTVAN